MYLTTLSHVYMQKKQNFLLKEYKTFFYRFQIIYLIFYLILNN